MKNLDIILAAMISAAIWVGFWMLKPPPQPPDISIHKAAGAGNIEAVKQHLAAGTDLNAPGGSGWNPLHNATFLGHKEIVELLIAKGADLNAKDDKYGRTPLRSAAIYDHKEIAEILIAEGADVNAKNQLGRTSLHAAASWGHKEVAELLIDNGADVNAKDFENRTPLDRAIKYKYPVLADLLRKHGGKTVEKLEAAGKPAEPVAEAAQPEPPTAKTPLWKAAMFGEIEPAKQAIADGADVNAKGERGLTPLHFAVVAALDSGDNKVIELLIANGADVNAKDDSGLTPLDSVKRLSEAATLVKRLRELQGKTDDIPVADLLRKHGGKTGEELKASGN
jgi:ankyrin repeat protein